MSAIPSHVTDIRLGLNPEGAARYRARCTCGWGGEWVTERVAAMASAFVHRATTTDPLSPTTNR